jgi:hypothetical protein
MDSTLDLIGSVEFGDWLINECEAETAQLESTNLAAYKSAKARLAALEQAKQLLLEFLTLQEQMLAFAGNNDPECSSGPDSRHPPFHG